MQSSADICWKKTNSFYIISWLQTRAGLQGNYRLAHWEHALCWHGNKTPPTTHVFYYPHTARSPAGWRYSFRHACMFSQSESDSASLNHGLSVVYTIFYRSHLQNSQHALNVVDRWYCGLPMLLRYNVESSFTDDSQQGPYTNKKCCPTHSGLLAEPSAMLCCSYIDIYLAYIHVFLAIEWT